MEMKKLLDLTGKVAIVTGGGRGLGEWMARGLAEMGASVVLCSRKLENCERVAEEFRADGLDAMALACDTGKEETVVKMVKDTVEKYGRVDILVNNAGTTWGAPIEEMTVDQWLKVMNTNAMGTFLTCREVIPYMKKQGYGRIINISSAAALGGSKWKGINAVGYSASKGAIISFSRDLAVKLRDDNICVNTVVPGHFATPMSKHTLQTLAELGKPDALGPIGKEDDMKGIVCLLASEASRFISGATITVDGTLTAQMADGGISLMDI